MLVVNDGLIEGYSIFLKPSWPNVGIRNVSRNMRRSFFKNTFNVITGMLFTALLLIIHPGIKCRVNFKFESELFM